eukprot:gene6666-8246_t
MTWAFLIAAMATRWYFVKVDRENSVIESEFSFYAIKIIRDSVTVSGEKGQIEYKWGEYDLSRVHAILNTCLAFAAISWLICLGIMITICLRQFEVFKGCPGSISFVLVLKCILILNFVCILISASTLAGITSGFKEDFENSKNPNSQFTACTNACDEKWSGTVNGVEEDTKFGPGNGFVLTVISGITGLAAAILPWFLVDDDVKSSAPSV